MGARQLVLEEADDLRAGADHPDVPGRDAVLDLARRRWLVRRVAGRETERVEGEQGGMSSVDASSIRTVGARPIRSSAGAPRHPARPGQEPAEHLTAAYPRHVATAAEEIQVGSGWSASPAPTSRTFRSVG
ncbi:hypothetical protein NKG94_10075 [Micromonospora sp. M12]